MKKIKKHPESRRTENSVRRSGASDALKLNEIKKEMALPRIVRSLRGK